MQIAHDRLSRLVAEMCRRGGADGDAAEAVARELVTANLFGHDSHGVGMMPAYVEGLQNGKLKVDAHARLVRERGPFLLFDGDRGFGQVVAAEAMNAGIETARQHGLAVVGLRNSYHIGRVGAWGEMCARAGFVSIHYVNAITSRSLVAPFGGADARYSTNPYCTAIPATATNPMLVLDMATSKIAMGKVRVAHNKGVEVPAESLIDRNGAPTSDPGVMFPTDGGPMGALRSFGLHKGYGLALICELLAGGLTGGGVALDERQEENLIANNMLTIILDPDLFGEGDFFSGDIDSLHAHVKASPPAPGVDEIMVPGDPERKSRAEREANGVPIDDQTWSELLEAADAVGLEPEEVLRIVGN